MTDVQTMVSNVFNELADALETGNFGKKTRVGVTILGSEHGVEEVVKGAELAQQKDASIEVVLIGSEVDSKLTQEVVANEDEGYKRMEEMLDDGRLDACVTMHYSFPIGVSTVGRVTTPAAGKDMIVATTTGTSATNRTEGMVLNALYGIATAKSMGIAEPTLGLLNVDNIRQVERVLKDLQKNGYPLHFAESNRADGGAVMRGITENGCVRITPTALKCLWNACGKTCRRSANWKTLPQEPVPCATPSCFSPKPTRYGKQNGFPLQSVWWRAHSMAKENPPMKKSNRSCTSTTPSKTASAPICIPLPGI
jgi:hypothetical protein